MDEVEALQARLDSALSALESGLRALAESAAGSDPAEDPRVAELAAENTALKDRLDHLTEEREKDLAQLDTLIQRLRPLIEEAV